MKLASHNNKLDTNVQNETKNFGIGDASVVIDILRNRLYEHKKQTLVQEYICNARDSHRELGKFDNKFDVTAPTHFNPVFKVRDYGPGITPDRMENVFVMYGASTKRSTNTQTGGFGIGAKSAWSYTDSFTIVSIVDGIKRSYIAHTGVNNNGRLDLISTETTTEPNGTEIQVGVNSDDIGDFKAAIFRAIYFWEEKPRVLGVSAAPTLVRGFRVGDIEVINHSLVPNYASYGDYGQTAIAVIDGVPYPLNEKLLQKCPALLALKGLTKEQLILHIDNGIVEVSASREAIADSTKSVDALRRIAERATKELKDHISDAFAKVTGTAEWVNLFKDLSNIIKIEPGYAKYKDYSLHGTGDYIYISSPLFKDIKATEIHCLGRHTNKRIEKITKTEYYEEVIDPKNPPKVPKSILSLPLKYFNDLYYVNQKESLIAQNKRVRAHLFDRGHNRFFLFETMNGNQKALDKVVADLAIKPFDTITYMVLPKEERIKVSREKTAFCMHVLDGSRFAYATLADNIQEWLYVPINKDGTWDYKDVEELKDLNRYLRPNLQICGLAERALKMAEGNENFTPLKKWLKDFKPSKEEILFVKHGTTKGVDKLEVLIDCKGIKDSLIAKVAKEYGAFRTKKLQTLPGILVDKTLELQEVKDFMELDKEAKELLKTKYPLVNEVSKWATSRHELVFYINAKFGK